MEIIIRTSLFVVFFLLFALVESLKPRRNRVFPRTRRWPSNLGIVVINNLVVRLLPWILPVRISMLCAERGMGILNFLVLPGWLEFAAAIIFMDMIIYWQHRLFHEIPALRRIHRMHHLEQDLDVTSGLKFHPFEMVISLLIKSASTLVLGLSVPQIIAFEVILNTMAMFNHANFFIPVSLDLKLRKIIVTPDMHRIHHSVYTYESNTNYGFNLSIWDYLFRSYTHQGKNGQEEMRLGHITFLDDKYTSIWWQLLIPFI